MAGTLTLRVITPERIVLDVPTAALRFPAVDGSTGVLPGHAALVAALGPGELSYQATSGKERMFIAGGFAEVRDNTVRIVTEASERPSDIDVERAQRAAERARDRLRELASISGAATIDAARAQAALRRALMRLSVVRSR